MDLEPESLCQPFPLASDLPSAPAGDLPADASELRATDPEEVRVDEPTELRSGEPPGHRVDGATLRSPAEASSVTEPFDCDLCRRRLERGDLYYELEIGLNSEPMIVGTPHRVFVQETSLLVFCERCEPALSGRVDTLLEALWDLRAPDPAPSSAG